MLVSDSFCDNGGGGSHISLYAGFTSVETRPNSGSQGGGGLAMGVTFGERAGGLPDRHESTIGLQRL
jgi:hypothetical protein